MTFFGFVRGGEWLIGGSAIGGGFLFLPMRSTGGWRRGGLPFCLIKVAVLGFLSHQVKIGRKLLSTGLVALTCSR
jgi:amino acid permease